MLQVNISVRDKSTFYIRIDMDCYVCSKQINMSLANDENFNGFINLVDEDGDIYMIRASEITDITIHKLSEGDDD